MRLKNNPKAKEIIEASKYVTNDIVFENNNPVCLEIGTGKCDFIIGMSQKYSDINFIGVEKYASVLVSGTKKLEGLELNNLKLMVMDASNIDSVFHNDIDILYLNFSDPWPKKRHAKRRLTSPFFLEIYDKIFKNSCKIQFKTDNRELFEYSLKSFVDHGYKIDKISLDLQNDDSFDNILTEYEEKFIKKGARIYMVFVYKN